MREHKWRLALSRPRGAVGPSGRSLAEVSPSRVVFSRGRFISQLRMEASMLRNLLVTTGMLLAMSVPTLAQTEHPASNAGSTAQPPQQQAVITQQGDSQVRVYRLIGSKVVGPDGQDVGKVDDLLLDRDQKLTAIIVGVGGFLGVGTKD